MKEDTARNQMTTELAEDRKHWDVMIQAGKLLSVEAERQERKKRTLNHVSSVQQHHRFKAVVQAPGLTILRPSTSTVEDQISADARCGSLLPGHPRPADRISPIQHQLGASLYSGDAPSFHMATPPQSPPSHYLPITSPLASTPVFFLAHLSFSHGLSSISALFVFQS